MTSVFRQRLPPALKAPVSLAEARAKVAAGPLDISPAFQEQCHDELTPTK
jgi:hypothetical protein